MTMQESRLMTVEEFEAFVDLPENANKRFEFIGGEIIEVPTNFYASKIAGLILTYLNMYNFLHNLGHVTGADAGFKIGDERYAPDVAFTSYETQKEASEEGYNPNPPNLAIEVVSSERKSEADELNVKLGNYLAAGIMVWIVRPNKKTVEVYESGKAVKIYRENDTIKLESVLPNFELKLSDIFKK
jgi:Uma2 family endonuclease